MVHIDHQSLDEDTKLWLADLECEVGIACVCQNTCSYYGYCIYYTELRRKFGRAWVH